MTTILLSTYCKCFFHYFFCKNIVKILLSFGYKIDVLSETVLEEDAAYIKSNDISISKYDIVITFNLAGYRRIKKYLKNRKFSHIFMCCRSDLTSQFLYDNEKFDLMVAIHDQQNVNLYPFNAPHLNNMYMPFQKQQGAELRTNKEKLQLLIHISRYEALLNIIPVVNQFQDIDVRIVSTEKINKCLLNYHISVIFIRSSTDIEQFVKDSDIVIGDRSTALMGLLYHKQVIVVGDRGLGGLINEGNIEMLFKTGFNGRVGAEMLESISGHLLSEELSTAIQKITQNAPFSSVIQYWIDQMYEQVSLAFNKMIHSAIKQSKYLWETNLRQNPSFEFIPVMNTQYAILDTMCGKIRFLIDKNEYLIIHAFVQINSPKKVFQNFRQMERTVFISYVKQLLNNKILLDYE